MAWVRIHDGAMSHPKIMALSDAAFRLWVKGLSFCQMNLTDGLIPREAARQMGSKRAIDELTSSICQEYAPLWEPHQIGYAVHDYVFWNDSRERIQKKRHDAKERKEAWVAKQRTEQRAERVPNAPHTTPLHSTDLTPLTPLAGGRVTRADRKHAREVRQKSHGGCRHEPRCENYDACVERIAQEIADRRMEAAS